MLAVLEEILREVEVPGRPEHLGGSALLLVDFAGRQGTDGLKTGLEPVAGHLLTRHVNFQTAVLTQQDHRGLLLPTIGRASVSDSHHVHNLGLVAHLDLLGGDLVRLQHDDDGVPGGLEDAGDDSRMSGHFAPGAENLRGGTLVAGSGRS